MGYSFALLLYADDGAIPADSLDDLQMAADIFVEYCNIHRLFISVPKTCFTVFHTEADNGVAYGEHGEVYVDDNAISIQIYGQSIKATSTFKYLGVHFDEYGSPHAHVEARTQAFLRGIAAFWAGLNKIPAYPHSFLLYLWSTLVAPVALYGIEAFAWEETDSAQLTKIQLQAWRRMLGVGGRAPLDAVQSSLGLDCITLTWRVRRVGLLLRLLNSPAGSLQQIAVITLRDLQSPWFVAALRDLLLVAPNISLSIMNSTAGPFLRSTGAWSEGGDWLCAQARGAYVEFAGQGIPRQSNAPIRRHVQRISKLVQIRLQRERKSQMVESITGRAEAAAYSKTLLLCMHVRSPGPPIHIALDWILERANRSALAALICGDLALGCYAGNFFARAFLPKRRPHLLDAESLGVEPSRVCLHCWHCHRQLVLETEGHAFFECPQNLCARAKFLSDVSDDARSRLCTAGSGEAKLLATLGSFSASDWNAFGRFCGRIRQSRRKLRQRFESMSRRLEIESFAERKTKWQALGRYVCRHGVFFNAHQRCSCLAPGSSSVDDWAAAKWMPHLDPDLKAMTISPFALENFERLGILQARLRRYDW